MEPDELVDTVKQYLDTHSNQYINALEEIRDILKSYQRSGTGKQAIYRITSRGDYQEGGSHIKKEAEIVEKIRRKRVKDPSYSESSVPDYIGLRLVCVYPSDYLP